MQFAFHFYVMAMRFFWSVEPAFAVSNSVSHYLHQPFSLVGAYAEETRLICLSRFPHILQVYTPRYVTKIIKFVVKLIAIYVVYMRLRPRTGYVSPRQSVRQILFVIYRYRPIAGCVAISGNFADKIGSSIVNAPCKLTKASVVIQALFNIVSRYHETDFTIGVA